MSKDCIMVSVDVGNSMEKPFSQDATRLKIAMQCFKLTLQQKIFNNSTHEVGLSIFGDDNTDDGNNCQLQPISKPELDLVRRTVQLSEASLENTKAGGDIFSAIQFVVDKIGGHCGKKKYNKRAFVFTNGMGDTDYTIKGLQRIIKKLKENQVKLNVIVLDFMETYDVDDNILEDESMMQAAQQKNAALLVKLRSLQMDNVQIFPGSLAIELYKKFRRRDVNPVALFKGNLEIAPGLQIEVSTYKGIRKQKMKSLQKYDMTQPWDPKISDKKEIVNDVSYMVEGDETGAVVDKDKMINAYPYGPNCIPISQMLEKGAKIFEEKNFKLLGFVDKSKIPRHALMGEADIVIPTDNPYSRKLFSAFIFSMISLNRYAIGRYIARSNKNGVSPKLVVLMPYRTPERELLYLIELPTAQDIREYPFNGLKQSTQKQREIVKELVAKMSLVRTVDGEQEQQIKIENTFNPVHQYLYQTVFHRAIHNDDEIPDLDPVIKRYITPEEKKYEETTQTVDKIKKQFKLTKKQLASQKAKEKKTVIWKDIITTDQRQIQTLSMADTELEEPVLMGKKFNFEDDDNIEHLDKANPITTFRKMLANNRKDLVDVAVKQLSELIQEKAFSAISKQNSKQIVELASNLRLGCIQQKQSQFWDNWLENCPSKIGEDLYRRIIAEGLGYINKSNESNYKKPESFHPVEEEEYDELD